MFCVSMFVGYSPNQKGYKCYISETRRILVLCDLKFIEENGYYEKKDWENLRELAHSPRDRATTIRNLLENLRNGNVPSSSEVMMAPHPTMESQEIEAEQNSEEEVVAEVVVENQEGDEIPEPTELNIDEDVHGDQQEEVTAAPDQEEEPPVLRRSQRIRKPSNLLNTQIYYNNKAVAHPVQATCHLAHFPLEHHVFLGQLELEEIPSSYEEAQRHKVRRDAVGDETGSMERNHTWDEADLPPGKMAVSSKWVFTIKYFSTGKIERHKARLVARGFTQTYGDDYIETFAPVAKLHTIRVVLSLATNLEWELWQMDEKNAFFQGDLEEEVYMTPPPGLEERVTPGKVLRLRKAIYGLKQSPRAWY